MGIGSLGLRSSKNRLAEAESKDLLKFGVKYIFCCMQVATEKSPLTSEESGAPGRFGLHNGS